MTETNKSKCLACLEDNGWERVFTEKTHTFLGWWHPKYSAPGQPPMDKKTACLVQKTWDNHRKKNGK